MSQLVDSLICYCQGAFRKALCLPLQPNPLTGSRRAEQVGNCGCTSHWVMSQSFWCPSRADAREDDAIKGPSLCAFSQRQCKHKGGIMPGLPWHSGESCSRWETISAGPSGHAGTEVPVFPSRKMFLPPCSLQFSVQDLLQYSCSHLKCLVVVSDQVGGGFLRMIH